MHDFERTSLWLNSLAERDEDDERNARAILRDRFFGIRKRAEQLVSVISRDIPSLTIHDVSHLDALWEVASLIAGKDYRLNPAEAFVFGSAVLLHDAAMSLAAFPKGLSAIKETPQWRDVLVTLMHDQGKSSPSEEELTNPPDELARLAMAEVLRELHAAHAEKLPTQTWPTDRGMEQLIEDSDLRNAYGHIIGKIAGSHWWPASELRKRLPRRVNAGPGIPSDWFVEPLKLACLLRVADAAHIDHRRAPIFLKALIKPTGISANHWTFQSRLGKPSADGQFLVYTGGPFDLRDTEAWWLCYEMIGLVDEELRTVHSLLDAATLPPFSIRGVKGAKSPEAIAELITTDGWRPVNTELRVSDIPALVDLLGGERLYGKSPTVAVRELIQNAADAIRAKRLYTAQPESGTIKVSLNNVGADWVLLVEDDGIGMSQNVLTTALLDFGRSFWKGNSIRREFPGLLSKGLHPTGRYGVGFFSVFMLGDRVTVTSRRFDAAASDTHTLDFSGGLRIRPILRSPNEDEALLNHGTRMCVYLRIPADAPKGLIHKYRVNNSNQTVDFTELVAHVCPVLDVKVEVVAPDGQKKVAVGANDWKSNEPLALLERLGQPAEGEAPSHLRELRDEKSGEVFGRACIYPSERSTWNSLGAITIGGFRAAGVAGIAGVFFAEAETVSRDSGMPIVPGPVLRKWATEQALLLVKTSYADVRAAALVITFGGKPAGLPIAASNWVTFSETELEQEFRKCAKVQVYGRECVDYDEDDGVLRRDFEREFEYADDVYLVPESRPEVLRVGELNWPACVPDLIGSCDPKTCLDVFLRILGSMWATGYEEDEDAVRVGSVDGTDIFRRCYIYTRPEAEVTEGDTVEE